MKKSMKNGIKMRILSVLLLVTLLLSFTSCSSSSVTVYVGEKPSELTPFSIETKADESYIENLFSGLYTYEKNGDGVYEILPGDAEGYPSVSSSEDGKTVLTFSLKEGLKWSSGEDITPEDYVYSWNKAADAYVGGEKEYIFASIDGFESFLDPDVDSPKLNISHDNERRILTVTLALGSERFLEYTTYPCMYPVSKKAVQESSDWHRNSQEFASNGAYILSSLKDNKLVMVKNESYRGSESIHTDKVTFIFDADEAKRASEKGSIDFAFTEVGKNSSTAVGMTFAVFNASDPAIGVYREVEKTKIRRAIMLYIKNAGIFPNMPNSISPSLSTGGSSLIPGGGDHGGGAVSGDIDYSRHDIAYADKLMSEVAESSGFFTWQDGVAYEFPILSAISAGREGEDRALSDISRELQKHGIKLTVRQMSVNEFLDEREEAEYSLLINSWTYSGANPGEVLYLFKSDSIYNDTHMTGDEWKEGYDRVLSSVDADKVENSFSAYKDALASLEKEALLLPLFEVQRNSHISDKASFEVLPSGAVRVK